MEGFDAMINNLVRMLLKREVYLLPLDIINLLFQPAIFVLAIVGGYSAVLQNVV